MKFSDEHVQMIRGTLPEECSEEDFQRFIFNAERLELDPLHRASRRSFAPGRSSVLREAGREGFRPGAGE